MAYHGLYLYWLFYAIQPVQLVESIRSVVALAKTTESMLTDFKNQDFSLNDEEINQLRQTVKGKAGIINEISLLKATIP